MKSLVPGYACLLCRTKGGSISMTLFRRRFNIYLLNLHRIEGESGGSPGTGGSLPPLPRAAGFLVLPLEKRQVKAVDHQSPHSVAKVRSRSIASDNLEWSWRVQLRLQTTAHFSLSSLDPLAAPKLSPSLFPLAPSPLSFSAMSKFGFESSTLRN